MALTSQGSLSGRTYEKEVDEEEDADHVQQLPRCPACSRECDAALILPCSHTMCRRCLASGETTRPDGRVSRGANKSVCSVLCPSCGRDVELPCWTWSSATSCLPRYPTPSPARGTKEGTAEDQLQQIRPSRDTVQSPSHGSAAASTSVAPGGGAVDLQDEEMEQSVRGLCFALDPSSVPPVLHLSNSFLTVTYHGERPPASPPDDKVARSGVASDPRVLFPVVCADVVIARGQYYWEVDVCNSSAYRIGVMSSDGCFGWWLQRRGVCFRSVYDGSVEPLCTIPPQIKTVGVFLNVGGGTLSFHNPLTQEHLATLPTRFSVAGVVPALGLGHGRLRLRCGLPPPAHVFLSRDSAYRRPRGAGGGRWRRELPFCSVRKVIQKFEELAGSDSDSGLVSGSGSSCSTLASSGDLWIPGTLYCDSREEAGSR